MCDAMTGSCDKCEGCKYYCQPEVYCGPECDRYTHVHITPPLDQPIYIKGSLLHLEAQLAAAHELIKELNNKGCVLADELQGIIDCHLNRVNAPAHAIRCYVCGDPDDALDALKAWRNE